MHTAPDLLTVGDVSRRLDEPEHRVAYVISSRRIEPVMRAGILRLFDPSVCETVRQELDGIDSRRPGPAPAATNESEPLPSV